MNKTLPRRKILKADPRKKTTEHRVIPNLSLRGEQIMMRLRNGTLKLDPNGTYSLNEKLDEGRRMSRIDAANAHRQNSIDMANMRSKLQNQDK